MSFISKWKDKISHYVDVRLNLLKLSMIERTSNILSYLIFVFIGLFLSVSVLIFIGIGVGEYFADVFDSRAAGFFTAALMYIILLAIMFLLRKPITNGFAGIFIRIMTAPDPDEEQEQPRKDVPVE